MTVPLKDCILLFTSEDCLENCSLVDPSGEQLSFLYHSALDASKGK